MNKDNRIAQLENEVRSLKAQLQKNENISRNVTDEIKSHELLEEYITSRKGDESRQALFIKTLQTFHLEKDVPTAMNMALAEIGEYINVSRVYIFEKNDERTAISNTYEWCNEGVVPFIETMQDLPVEFTQPWFDIFDAGGYICTSDIKTLSPKAYKFLNEQNIKAIMALPLTINGVHYGFIGFDECSCHREWDEEDVALLSSISQIISTVTQRYVAEKEVRLLGSQQSILIKVLKTMHSTECLSEAIDLSLATLGEYTGVSRVYIFEKDANGATFSNTHEWCNEGITPYINNLQNLPIENAQSWFNIFDDGGYICTNDVNTLTPKIAEDLAAQSIKSIIIIPLTSRGNHYGFVGFDECTFHRVWDLKEIALLKNLSQIISTTTQRYRAETNLRSVSSRQDLFIKVLQILYLEKDIPTAMNRALAEIGKFTQMSRMQIWENDTNGVTYGVSYEWCNEGVEPAIHYLKAIPLEYGKPWFDMLIRDRMICTSDIGTLHPAMIEILAPQGVKAIVVLPLAEYGKFFGYISFTVTEDRIWEKEDVELLKNIAQIVSTTSKRYQAETVIKQQQQVMQTVLDNINSNIFVIDCETSKILFANKSFKDEIGEEPEGLICWQSFKAGLTKECEHCPKLKLLDENGRPNDMIQFWEDYNPISKRWYTIATKALEWVDGRSAIMEFSTDTSDRKNTELELLRAKEKAEEADNLKSAFLANMSHEIRTPINGIIGFMRFLAADDLSPERRREFVNIINNSSLQLTKLIDDIIDVAKIEAKQMSINPVPVHINPLMEELHLFFETSLQVDEKKHITLILDDSGFIDDCVALVDAMRLRQVITNLLNNAIKFTEKGYILFGYRQSAAGELEFMVEDTGIGINPEQMEIIFERFRQAHITHDRLYGGTGLGLHISRTLVQMMGGDMWVKSKEGIGSSFYFTISYLPVLS